MDGGTKWPSFWRSPFWVSNEEVRISMKKKSLMFVLHGPIENKPALVQIVAWRCPNQWGYTLLMHIYESLGLSELTFRHEWTENYQRLGTGQYDNSIGTCGKICNAQLSEKDTARGNVMFVWYSGSRVPVGSKPAVWIILRTSLWKLIQIAKVRQKCCICGVYIVIMPLFATNLLKISTSPFIGKLYWFLIG